MRYYNIKITNDDGTIVRPSWARDLNLPGTYVSAIGTNVGGNSLALQTLPGALRVELDLNLRPFYIPRQGSVIRIHGVSNEELSQSYDLSLKNIQIDVGMARGLPLAKPRKTYTALYGRIFQAFGNLQGLDRYVELVIVPPWGGREKTQINFDWQPDTPMAQAIETSLKTAFPSYTIDIRISDDLKQAAPQQASFMDDLGQFNKLVYNLSNQSQFQNLATIDGSPYAGVSIVVRGRTLLVYDGTKDYGVASSANPTEIDFDDLIGQPTWISPNVINFKCVMRADIQVGDFVKLPKTLQTPYVLSTQGSAFPYPNIPSRNNSTFQGVWRILELHYFGDSRQASADSWVTTYDAVPIGTPAPAGTVSVGQPQLAPGS